MRKDWHLSNVSENKTMKLDAVLKSIDEAIRCVESARYFSQSDKPETAQERCSEAKGNCWQRSVIWRRRSQMKAL